MRLITPTIGRRSRRRGWRALPALAVAAALAIPATPALAQEQEPAPITEGYVDWGVKESWRKYVGNEELKGGAEKLPSGEYRWPIAQGNYDPESQSLRLELEGSVRFQSYCENDLCQLDSTFSDLVLEITGKQQTISGTYTGRPESNPGGPLETKHGVFATIDISLTEPDLTDGHTSWAGLPTVAGDGLLLYAAGTPIDPVSIRYAGPGGKPSLAERWASQGVPEFTHGPEWKATSNVVPGYYLTEDRETLIAFEKFDEEGQTPAHFRFTALDSTSLEVLGQTDFAEGETSYAHTAFDPGRGTMFFKSGSQHAENYVVSLHTATWSPELREFSIERAIDSISSDGLQSNEFLAGPLFVWNPVTSEFIWSKLRRSPDSDPLNDHRIRSLSREDDGSWTAAEAQITLPEEARALHEEMQATFFGNENPDSHNPAEALILKDGSILLAVRVGFESSPGVTKPFPLTKIVRGSDGHWSSETIPGAFGQDSIGYGEYAFANLVWAADGSILAGGNAWSGALGYFTIGDGTSSAEHIDPSPGNKTLKVLGVGSDPALGIDYSVDAIKGSVNMLKNRKPVGSFDLPDSDYHSRILATSDHGIVVATSAGYTSHSIRRLDLVAVAPEFTTQPVDATVSLTQGALSGSASLGVEWSATGDTTVQWQRKLPTQKRFTDVPGATTAQFAPEVELEHDGAEFRAVLSNAAGKVVSDTAKVTVASAPRFLAQPTDLTIRDGDTARLTAPIAPGITGAQRWEHLTGDTWTPIETGGPFTVAGDTLTIIANPDLDGAQFRSVLANDVGENTSDAAALTVLAKTVIPAEGQKYEGVTFEWDVSNEVQAKPPFGGANHLSAGVSDGSEASYQAEAGNVRITHTTADGTRTPASYATRAAFVGTGGKQLLTLTGGTATVKPDGSAVVTWQGAFSINMYGGLVPFTITNPTLTVTPDGTGTLTGDMSGYAGDMQNPTVKTPIDPVTGVTIATFTGAKLDTLNPFTVTPEYAGVRVNLPAEATPQLQTGEHWGSWPQGFVDFQVKTGLSSYWYSSGSSFDPKKAPNPITIDFTTAEVVTPPVAPEPITPAPEIPAPETPAPETPKPGITDVADPGAGSKDTGSKDTGSKNTGSKDTGSKNTAAKGAQDGDKKLAKTGAADALGLSAAAALLLLAGAAAVTVGSRTRKEAARP